MTTFQPLRVGSILHGFCAGYFGRDSYSCKKIEAIGADWIVTRNKEGKPEFAVAFGKEDLLFALGQDSDKGCNCN